MKNWMSRGGVGLAAALTLGACGGRGTTTVGVINTDGSGGESSSGKTGGLGAPRSTDAGAKELYCDRCAVIADALDIRQVRATADRVYWIEYGTFDKLGNHLDDGKLKYLPLDGGEPVLVAAELQGPLDFAVSGNYAYAMVERSTNTSGLDQLVQIALADGSAREVYPVHSWGGLVTQGDTNYAINAGTILRIQNTATAEPEPLTTTIDHAALLGSDDELLYEQTSDGIRAIPLSGGEPSLLWRYSEQGALTAQGVVGDYIYAVEHHDDGGYLARMPKAGDAFKRIARASSLSYSWHIDGTRFVNETTIRSDGSEGYVDRGGITAESFLVDGLLADLPKNNKLLRVPELNEADDRVSWDVNDTHVFIGYKNTLYSVPRSN